VSLLKWGWIPLIGLGLVAWGYFGAAKPEPTAIFSTAALFVLAGGAVAFGGAILLVVMYTAEQNTRRAQAHSSDHWHANGGGQAGTTPRP
jgi:hypothetical protein